MSDERNLLQEFGTRDADSDSLYWPSADAADGGDQWHELAVLWHERALAAEFLTRMLQRNLDDLRANLEEHRGATQGDSTKQLHRTPPDPAPVPWRQFLDELYSKYGSRRVRVRSPLAYLFDVSL